MQDPNYAGKYGVEQQLKLLSKWLAETGFSEASMLVSAAAISVYEAMRKKPKTRPRSGSAAAAASPPADDAVPALDGPVMEQKRRAHGT